MKKVVRREPKLRFPEFQGDWNSHKTNELFDRIKNGVEVRQDEFYQEIGIRSHGKGVFHKTPVLGKSLGNKRVFWIKKNVFILNIVFAWEQAVSKTTENEIGLIASHRFPMFEPKKGLADLDYFLGFFLTKKGKHLLGLASPGGAGRNKTLGQKVFDELNVVHPALPEQQKIASFLSAIDQKLQQLSRKKELLEQYKKGVMQKIFSREIRFQDENGNKYPDWQEKRLGDVLTFMSTNSLSRNDLTYESGEIKNIHYGDIHKIFKMGFDAAKEQVPYINRTIDLKKIPEEYFCQVGDVIIADASEDYNDIGKAIEIWDLSGEKIVAGLHTFLGRDKTGQTTNGFKGYLLQTSLVRKQIQKSAQGISVLGISKKNLAKVEFRLPCKKEQMKIIALLKSLDRKIETAQTQLTQTRTFKKGLLQQLFV